jgi:hypothetical protein
MSETSPHGDEAPRLHGALSILESILESGDDRFSLDSLWKRGLLVEACRRLRAPSKRTGSIVGAGVASRIAPGIVPPEGKVPSAYAGASDKGANSPSRFDTRSPHRGPAQGPIDIDAAIDWTACMDRINLRANAEATEGDPASHRQDSTMAKSPLERA